jgi:hypothetical protein
VSLQRGPEVFDLGLQGRSGKPKEDDAGVAEPLTKNQLAEIPVGDQQNSLPFPGKGKDILIGKTGRVIAGNARNIMTEAAKVGDQPEIGALVEQEFHTGAASEAAPFGGFGETSSPVTIALA